MRLRIIAGTYGGRFITAPPTKATHPMSERARLAMFNSLGSLVADARVLDAFAGSGAIGLEALSRGAKEVTFVERDRVAGRVLVENIAALKAEPGTIVINTTVSNCLKTATPDTFDLIFADPPYHQPQFATIKRLMGLLKPGGHMILSHQGTGEVPLLQNIVVVDDRCYANAHLTTFRKAN